MIRNEDYAEIRVPFDDLHENLAKFEKTLAYRRLNSRSDKAWGLVWDLKVHQDLTIAELALEECQGKVRALVASLEAAMALLTPIEAEGVRNVYREASNG